MSIINFLKVVVKSFTKCCNDVVVGWKNDIRHLLTSTLANVLKSKGVEKGDRVAVYMPMILELPVVMLACTRIGAIHSVVVMQFFFSTFFHS